MELALVIIIIIIFYFVVTLVPLVLNGFFLGLKCGGKLVSQSGNVIAISKQTWRWRSTTRFGFDFPSSPLNIYYNEENIITIEEKLAKPKVHNKTVGSLIGSYARVRVEIDLRKPLNPFVVVGKNDYYIEYEHVHLICFSCGWVGHGRENCYNSWTLWHKACSLQRVWAMWRLKLTERLRAKQADDLVVTEELPQ